MFIKATVRGLTKLKRDLKAESKRQKKAMVAAIKVEGYRLRKLLIKEIKQGAPGGRRFKGMRAISRYEGGRFMPDKPLANKGIWKQGPGGRWRGWSLADVVRYDFPRGRNPLTPRWQMAVGWTGPDVSKSWKRLAKKHQEGFSAPIDQYWREGFRWYGGAAR